MLYSFTRSGPYDVINVIRFRAPKKQLHSVPDNGTVRLTGTYLLPLTGLLVVRISNFEYSVPVNRTPVNGTVRLTGSPVNECPVNGNGVYSCNQLHQNFTNSFIADIILPKKITRLNCN